MQVLSSNAPFLVRDLSFRGVWCLRQVLEPITQGQLYKRETLSEAQQQGFSQVPVVHPFGRTPGHTSLSPIQGRAPMLPRRAQGELGVRIDGNVGHSNDTGGLSAKLTNRQLCDSGFVTSIVGDTSSSPERQGELKVPTSSSFYDDQGGPAHEMPSVKCVS